VYICYISIITQKSRQISARSGKRKFSLSARTPAACPEEAGFRHPAHTDKSISGISVSSENWLQLRSKANIPPELRELSAPMRSDGISFWSVHSSKRATAHPGTSVAFTEYWWSSRRRLFVSCSCAGSDAASAA